MSRTITAVHSQSFWCNLADSSLFLWSCWSNYKFFLILGGQCVQYVLSKDHFDILGTIIVSLNLYESFFSYVYKLPYLMKMSVIRSFCAVKQ